MNSMLVDDSIVLAKNIVGQIYTFSVTKVELQELCNRYLEPRRAEVRVEKKPETPVAAPVAAPAPQPAAKTARAAKKARNPGKIPLKILKIIAANKAPMRPKDICALLPNVVPASISTALLRMKGRGAVGKNKDGAYFIAK